jgi:hypothetical protein
MMIGSGTSGGESSNSMSLKEGEAGVAFTLVWGWLGMALDEMLRRDKSGCMALLISDSFEMERSISTLFEAAFRYGMRLLNNGVFGKPAV